MLEPEAPAGVTAGSIISHTFAMISNNAMFVAIFVLAFSVLGSTADALTASPETSLLWSGGMLQLLIGIASVVVLYLLLSAMLRSASLQEPDLPRRYLAFLGQGIVMALAVVFGLLMLVVPGLILSARWSIAQPLLVGRGQKVFEALSDSWEATRGHTTAIIVAGIVLFGALLVPGIGIVMLLDADDMLTVIAIQLIGNACSVLSTALMAALMQLIRPPMRVVTDVFA